MCYELVQKTERPVAIEQARAHMPASHCLCNAHTGFPSLLPQTCNSREQPSKAVRLPVCVFDSAIPELHCRVRTCNSKSVAWFAWFSIPREHITIRILRRNVLAVTILFRLGYVCTST